MNNELNWFHIQRWNKNRRARQLHDFEMSKKTPPNTEQQIINMLAKGNVTITRSKSKENETDDKKEKDRK